MFDGQQGLAAEILKSMNESVLFANNKREMILINLAAEKMFNILEPQAIGRSVREVVRNNEITDLMERSIATGEKIHEEISIIIPFEAVFDADIGPVLDKKGNVIGVVCVLHDISDLRRLEKHRSEFVANVSHELKTPLTAIKNYVETLLMGAINDKENNMGFLKKVENHADNLSALIDDILELSKLESKKELGVFSKIDVNQLILKAVDTVSEKAKKRNISIEKDIPVQPLYVSGSQDHVYRAILNLLENAINYSNPASEVEVSSKRTADKIEIIVRDNGLGIAEGHLPRIFERFYRTDAARSRELGGTGLGLAIVKHVMNAHNGAVSVESELGRGSTFTLVFPAI